MANNWEYHQDERDKAYGCAAILLLGTMIICVAAVVAVIVASFVWLP